MNTIAYYNTSNEYRFERLWKSSSENYLFAQRVNSPYGFIILGIKE